MAAINKIAKYSGFEKRKFPFIYLFIAFPVLQFLVFWVYVNFSSIVLAFQDGDGKFTWDCFEMVFRALKEPQDYNLSLSLWETMKRSLFFILLLTCLLAVFAVTASAEVFEGKAVDEQWIRDNEGTSQEFEDGNILNVAPYYRIWYKLDTETGKLYLYPKGADQKMLPYARFEWVPWLKAEDPNVQRPFILEAELEYGVLTVGRYSFYQCENLHTVYLPSSIYKIDQTVFYECPSLETVHYAGTKEDFEKYVLFDKTRNDEALDKFVFGESVTVIAKNQHGDVLEEYIVGGYAVGDSYSFLPKKYEGMTYTGDPYKAITGTFVENDQTVYELIYECNHSYQSVSEDKPCISRCVYCKHDNPNSLHVFNDEGTIPCVGVCRLCNEFTRTRTVSISWTATPRITSAATPARSAIRSLTIRTASTIRGRSMSPAPCSRAARPAGNARAAAPTSWRVRTP